MTMCWAFEQQLCSDNHVQESNNGQAAQGGPAWPHVQDSTHLRNQHYIASLTVHHFLGSEYECKHSPWAKCVDCVCRLFGCNISCAKIHYQDRHTHTMEVLANCTHCTDSCTQHKIGCKSTSGKQITPSYMLALCARWQWLKGKAIHTWPQNIIQMETKCTSLVCQQRSLYTVHWYTAQWTLAWNGPDWDCGVACHYQSQKIKDPVNNWEPAGWI